MKMYIIPGMDGVGLTKLVGRDGSREFTLLARDYLLHFRISHTYLESRS